MIFYITHIILVPNPANRLVFHENDYAINYLIVYEPISPIIQMIVLVVSLIITKFMYKTGIFRKLNFESHYGVFVEDSHFDFANRNSFIYISLAFLSRKWFKTIYIRMQTTCLDNSVGHGFISPLNNYKIWYLSAIRGEIFLKIPAGVDLLIDFMGNNEQIRTQNIEIPVKDIHWTNGNGPEFSRALTVYRLTSVSFIRFTNVH